MSESGTDRELEAMIALSRAMSPFKDEDRPVVQRILAWLNSKYGHSTAKAAVRAAGTSSDSSHAEGDDATPKFSSAADCYDAVGPDLEYEKALTIGYWFQVCNNQQDFTSQDVNSTLKNMGHGIGNITDAFNTAKDRKPALVMQTQKSGTSKQARKMYKLTTAGIRWVESRLKGGSEAADGGKEDE